MPKIGVAMSGGGHRATVWGLGALLGLAHTSLGPSLSAVSSVSGGSLTNGHLGLQPTPGPVTADRAGFERIAGGLARTVAGSPFAYRCVWTLHLMLVLWLWYVVLASSSRDVSVGPIFLPATLLMLASIFLGSWAGGVLFGWRGTWLYLDVLAGVGAATLWFALAAPGWRWRLGAGGLGSLLLGLLVLLRPWVAGRAFAATVLRAPNGRRAQLNDLTEHVSHLICATELHAGHHVYFSRDFIYCYDVGLTTSTDRGSLHAAVEASANLPGAFPVRWLRARRFAFVGGHRKPGWLALTDGGVYDNMADEWFVEPDRRVVRVTADIRRALHLDDGAALPTGVTQVLERWLDRAPDLLIVVNASKALQWRRLWPVWLPWIGEFIGLQKVSDVLYDNGTSVRRRELVGSFDAGSRSGTLVHIMTDSVAAMRVIASERDPAGNRTARAVRAERARTLLTARGSDEFWQTLTQASAAVPTVFRPLGRKRTVDLLYHAYVQTLVNLYVFCDIEEPVIAAREDIDRLLDQATA